jgi:hypothetical protein
MKVEPSGRKLGHWEHALEGSIGTLAPPSVFLFLLPVRHEVISFLPHVLLP